MSTVLEAPVAVLPITRRAAVNIADEARIPDWVGDLASFRCWAESDDYPESGRFSFLNDEIWVDLSMEQLFTHNQVKTELIVTLGQLIKREQLGYLFADGVRISHHEARLSTEPDGLFVSFAAVKESRVRLVEGKMEGFVEVEGAPDLVLEVVSRSSVRKDTVVLRDLYWRAGISEYWLFDARDNEPRFDILRHTPQGYVETSRHEDWVASLVLQSEFRLDRETDSLGHPQWTLEVRRQLAAPHS